jgi:hypothetical protein
MTRDEIMRVCEAALTGLIDMALFDAGWDSGPRPERASHLHADLLDECERRWHVVISVHPFLTWDAAKDGRPGTMWVADARDGDTHQLLVENHRAPTRRLAELRALALALKERGVLA